MKKTCLQCNKKFQKLVNCSLRDWNNTKRFCSVKCHNEFRKGKTSSSPETTFKKGQKPSLETLEKNRQRIGSKNNMWKGGQSFIDCKTCGKTFGVDQYRQNTAKTCSKECHNIYRHTPEFRLRLSEIQRGLVEKELGNIRSSLTKIDKIIRKSAQYKLWREFIFKRDNFTCQNCGVRGVYIHADHIKQFGIILLQNNVTTFEEALVCKEIWDVENGRTLCVQCHVKTPTYARQVTKLKI